MVHSFTAWVLWLRFLPVPGAGWRIARLQHAHINYVDTVRLYQRRPLLAKRVEESLGLRSRDIHLEVLHADGEHLLLRMVAASYNRVERESPTIAALAIPKARERFRIGPPAWRGVLRILLFKARGSVDFVH